MKKKTFSVKEMAFLHFLAEIKEMEVSGATFGRPKKTSQISRWGISHNTSSLKGLMK
jgi:hypothetical protein